MAVSLVTIGTYGYDEAGFFEALRKAKVDTFCDIRMRRGVRGSEYAFVNATRLEAKLEALGIRYVYLKELAPTHQIVALQQAADKQHHVGQTKREELSPAFVYAYEHQKLADYDSKRFLERVGPEARVAALFCFERHHEACHRSLVAAKLAADLGLSVRHLEP